MSKQTVLLYWIIFFRVGVVCVLLISTGVPSGVKGSARDRSRKGSNLHATSHNVCNSPLECRSEALKEAFRKLAMKEERGLLKENAGGVNGSGGGQEKPVSVKEKIRPKFEKVFIRSISDSDGDSSFGYFDFHISDELINRRIHKATLKVPIIYEYAKNSTKDKRKPRFKLHLTEFTSRVKPAEYFSLFDGIFTPKVKKFTLPNHNSKQQTAFLAKVNIKHALINFMDNFLYEQQQLIVFIEAVRNNRSGPNHIVLLTSNYDIDEGNVSIGNQNSTDMNVKIDKNDPYIEVQLVRRNQSRQRRSLHSAHNTTYDEDFEACGIRRLKVRVDEIGFGHLVRKPKKIEANYCAGKCDISISRQNFRKKIFEKGVPGYKPCCAPSKVYNRQIQMHSGSYWDPYELQIQVVNECKCY